MPEFFLLILFHPTTKPGLRLGEKVQKNLLNFAKLFHLIRSFFNFTQLAATKT